MKSPITYSKGMTLGPFLTLILLSSPERGRAMTEDLLSRYEDVPAPDYTRLAIPEEMSSLSASALQAPLNVGPLLTLILTSGRSRPKAGGEWQSPVEPRKATRRADKTWS